MYQTQAYYVTSFGQTLKKLSKGGVRMKEVLVLYLEQTLSKFFLEKMISIRFVGRTKS